MRKREKMDEQFQNLETVMQHQGSIAPNVNNCQRGSAALCEGNYAPDEIEQAKKLTGRYTRIIYSSIGAAHPNCGPLENRHCPPQRPCYIEARDCGRGLTEF
jgi:hypothetical protein